MNKFLSKTEVDGMHVVLSDDGNRRIPVGRSQEARLQAEAIATTLSEGNMAWHKASLDSREPRAEPALGAPYPAPQPVPDRCRAEAQCRAAASILGDLGDLGVIDINVYRDVRNILLEAASKGISFYAASRAVVANIAGGRKDGRRVPRGNVAAPPTNPNVVGHQFLQVTMPSYEAKSDLPDDRVARALDYVNGVVEATPDMIGKSVQFLPDGGIKVHP